MIKIKLNGKQHDRLVAHKPVVIKAGMKTAGEEHAPGINVDIEIIPAEKSKWALEPFER